MKIKYLLFLLLPALLLASEEAGVEGGTDIFPRTINFILFASILYYLVAQPAKDFFKGRIAGIASQLDSIQVKVKSSMNAKNEAKAKVEEAKANAKILVETAKKEIVILSEKIVKDTDVDLLSLEKSFNEKTEVERRRMTRNVVSSVLEEMFSSDTIAIDKEELVKIVMKKVA